MARLSFGFPSVRSSMAKLAIALVVASVVVAVGRPLVPYVLLSPAAVLSGWLWQPFSYVPIETSPLGVIFSGLIVWSIGGALEYQWGQKRTLWFSLGVTVLAGFATVLLALPWTRLQGGFYAGGAVLSGALWVAYGLTNGNRQLNFWGLPMSGNLFALVGAGFVFLNAAFGGMSSVVPHALALLLTFLYVRGLTPSGLWTRLRSWQLSRQLKRRSKHLQVVSDERRNMPHDSDRYLH